MIDFLAAALVSLAAGASVYAIGRALSRNWSDVCALARRAGE